MLDYIIGAVCLVLALAALILKKEVFYLPLNELKRRAGAGDAFARTIYPLAAYGIVARSLLWLITAAASAAALALFASIAPIWLGIVLIVFWLWLAFSWLPNTQSNAIGRIIANTLSPIILSLSGWLEPVFKHSRRVGGIYRPAHTGIYEVGDLTHFFERQKKQADNRIDDQHLDRLTQLIKLNELSVADAMTGWKNVYKLADEDNVGPKLLDDLHRSGQSVFPVIRGKTSRQVLGILVKDDLNLHSQGRVRDYMSNRVETIKETAKIAAAIAMFARGGIAILIVVNSAGDTVGVISLKDALKGIVKMEPDLEDYEVEESDETELALTEANDETAD